MFSSDLSPFLSERYHCLAIPHVENGVMGRGCGRVVLSALMPFIRGFGSIVHVE